MLDLHVDETTYGGRGFARTSLGALGQRHDLELGYYARADSVQNDRQRVGSSGVPYKTDVDLGALEELVRSSMAAAEDANTLSP